MAKSSKLGQHKQKMLPVAAQIPCVLESLHPGFEHTYSPAVFNLVQHSFWTMETR